VLLVTQNILSNDALWFTYRLHDVEPSSVIEVEVCAVGAVLVCCPKAVDGHNKQTNKAISAAF
jgi:hypothetical protein